MTFFQRGFLLHLAHKFQPIHDIAFWGIKLSRKTKQYYRFEGTCCLFLQGNKDSVVVQAVSYTEDGN